jgi:hypothetical protein
MMRLRHLAPLLAATLSCNGTTGYDLVQFYAAASGFADATRGQPYAFDAPGGVHVTLTQARLHVGAIYLTQSVPQAGGGPQPCILPQTYEGAFVGEVRGEGDIDLLDPSAQPIQAIGDGSTLPAATGQVWLVHDNALSAGDLNGSDPFPVLTLEGTFEDAGGTHTFAAGITIDTGRISVATGSVLPGQAQICEQRIVSGIPAQLTLAEAGTLVLRVGARALFTGVPFTDLPPCVSGTAADFCFTDDDSNESSRVLFANLKSTGPYGFTWQPKGP